MEKSLFARAPSDCVQYFTGATGSVKSYNFQGGQLLASQYYTNCIRTEKGYCGNSKLNIFLETIFFCLAIQWKESSSTSPDPFKMTAAPTAVAGTGAPTACPNSFIYIPNLRS